MIVITLPSVYGTSGLATSTPVAIRDLSARCVCRCEYSGRRPAGSPHRFWSDRAVCMRHPSFRSQHQCRVCVNSQENDSLGGCRWLVSSGSTCRRGRLACGRPDSMLVELTPSSGGLTIVARRPPYRISKIDGGPTAPVSPVVRSTYARIGTGENRTATAPGRVDTDGSKYRRECPRSQCLVPLASGEGHWRDYHEYRLTQVAVSRTRRRVASDRPTAGRPKSLRIDCHSSYW